MAIKICNPADNTYIKDDPTLKCRSKLSSWEGSSTMVNKPAKEWRAPYHGGVPTVIAGSLDASLVAIGNTGRSLNLYDTQKRAHVGHLELPKKQRGPVECVAVSADGLALPSSTSAATPLSVSAKQTSGPGSQQRTSEG
jgi:hypothetical protein